MVRFSVVHSIVSFTSYNTVNGGDHTGVADSSIWTTQ